MSIADIDTDGLISRIKLLESELSELKRRSFAADAAAKDSTADGNAELGPGSGNSYGWPWPLEAEEYTRYGRQMIMPEIGIQGQLSLRKSSVLIIGVGGLGCPAAQYLAGAGIGTIGLVDGDVVEWSNLHRQILHNTERVGWLKVDSAIEGLRQLNPKVNYVGYRSHLAPSIAVATMESYDLILDCTDHPKSRYLISDAAVLSGKPLISGSALKTEGQLMILNNPPTDAEGHAGGHCYRCIFPKPPPPESVVSCGEGGILGPVVGVIGVLMALEAIKIITSKASTPRPHEKMPTKDESASMLLFSAYSTPQFRQVRLRGKRQKCKACSASRTITKDLLASGSLDYEQLCGTMPPVNILERKERIDVKMLKQLLLLRDKPYILLDVRDETQFGICNLEGSINIPYTTIESMPEPKSNALPTGMVSDTANSLSTELDHMPPDASIYTICRFGNDSQLTVRKLKALGLDRDGKRWIGDVRGGFKAWKEHVDPQWPEY